MTAADKLAELLALAEKATPGPWILGGTSEFIWGGPSGESLLVSCSDGERPALENMANAKYIAAASPGVVAALVRVAAAAEANVDSDAAFDCLIEPLRALSAALTGIQSAQGVKP